MLKKIFIIISSVLVLLMCSKDKNPFFSDYNTPYGVPPFDKIREDHFLSAFKEGMLQQQENIKVIINVSEEPNFKNVIEALENSGELLDKVVLVFDNLKSAHTSDGIQKIAKEVAPLRSKHQDDIYLNDKLFQRVKAVYEKSDQLNLTTEQKAVLEDYYQDFVRGGANLSDEDQNKLREINKELSTLTLQFSENLLKENNSFELIIENQENLAGLPETVIRAAAETAKEKGYQGKWVFTTDKPSLIPFLTHSAKRNLREEVFKAYINQCNHDDKLDNKEIAAKMVALRVKKANLLGYKTHADFVLEERMAKRPENVYNLLFQLWTPALEKAKVEAEQLQRLIDEEGTNFKLQPWDWWYYTEKLRKAKYDLDEEELKQYFKLENVREGVFMVANRLFGITLEENSDIPVYHPDVKAFEVKEADGTLLGILYVDYFPRASKRAGAWMSNYRVQYKIDGNRVTPIVTNVFNFPRPTKDTPSLLSLDNVEALFHEFGHGLHGLLSDCHYRKLSGTNVAWDFVELPSQIMENWATEPEVLRSYAKHYQTGEPIPDALVDKIQETSKFNQGFKTVELLAASFLDMDWHTVTDTSLQDPIAFEEQSLNKINLIPEIVVRYRTPYFRHIFAGDYSAGYYSYIWAEVLDADAFQAFKETSLFNPKFASAYRENILGKGGTEDPMTLYSRFRGTEPKIKPLLEKRGLNE
jgi:peptidyl-dipeptidase Dcp